MADNAVHPQFDFATWYHCSLWWRQYLYWQSHLNNTSHPSPAYTAAQQRPPPLVQPTPPRPPTFTLQIRLTNGYESYIAPLWRRLLAEIIDTLFVCAILKWFIPSLDYRVPEAMFLSSDEIMQMEEDEIDTIAWTMITFFLSIFLERCTHVLMELFFTYHFGCTPGKWIMGLRIVRCNSIHYTRTDPPRTVKIEPGTGLGLWQALLRCVFKAVVSLFCPLIIFFIVLNHGRPQYDRAFHTAVIHHRYMYRPA